MRGSIDHELLITLEDPLERALLVDWRRRPFYRFLMRLPWSLKGSVIRIPLDAFDRPPEEIAQSFTRMMGFYKR